MQWRYWEEGGIGVLELVGYLGVAAVEQFDGAVGWVLAHGGGPVVIDVSGLQGWSVQGELAIVDAGIRLAAHDRRLALCGLDAGAAIARELADIAIFADLDAAHAALIGRVTGRNGPADGAG